MEENTVAALSKNDLHSLSGKELAFLGDSVYETCVRKKLIVSGFRGSKELSMASKEYVSASAQAKIYDSLYEGFFEDEKTISNRGRNTKQHNSPKSATLSEYRRATALECVFGYLYITGKTERINELIEIIFNEKA